MPPVTHWADYDKIAGFAKGEQIDSPPGNPYPYTVGRKAEKKDPLMGVLGLMLGVERNKKPPVVSEGYFINMNRLPAASEAKDSNQFITVSDWKFHLSIHPDDVPLAWNSIAPYLQEENITHMKVGNPKTVEEHGMAIDPECGKRNPQHGKMIVLYVADTLAGKPHHSKKDWQRVINGVEKRLAEAGVRPGPEVPTDKAVKGSMYSYYRSDKISSAMKPAYEEIKNLNDDIAVEKFVAEAKQRIGPDYDKKISVLGSKEEQEFNEGLLAVTDEAPPKEPLLVPRDKMREVLVKHLVNKTTGFTVADAEALIPDINADLKFSRLKLLDLPPEKRYKLPTEKDRFEGLHIEQPNIQRAEQERAEKSRGVNART